MKIYKVGDKVKVKYINSRYEGDLYKAYFVSEMEALCGKFVTITRTEYYNNLGEYRYLIKEDNGRWLWSSDMFKEFVCDNNFTDLTGIL